VNRSDTAAVPAAFKGFDELNTGTPTPHVCPGPYTSNVTDPVGVGEPAGAGLKVAVSRNGVPIGTDAGATCVVNAKGPGAIVTSRVPIPVAEDPVETTPCEKPNSSVCTPAIPGFASIDGTRRTLTVKLITHDASKPPGFDGPNVTGADGVNVYLPSAASPAAIAIANESPPHAVPVLPVPVALN
jgi:hypothetical protein